LAKRERNSLTKEDVVVVWGGANDMNKNEWTVRLIHIKNVVVNRKHTNIVMMNAPHSHDVSATSSINKEVQVNNRKLPKIMKSLDHIKTIETNFMLLILCIVINQIQYWSK
jgi:hypothetical protein